MAVIVDVGNRQYYEMRAFEMARDAGEGLELSGDNVNYHEKMIMAISMLALARAAVPLPAPTV